MPDNKEAINIQSKIEYARIEAFDEWAETFRKIRHGTDAILAKHGLAWKWTGEQGFHIVEEEPP